MSSPDELSRRIDSMDDLGDIVRSMKALAAAHIQHYERAARALAEHARTIELAFRAVLRDRAIAALFDASERAATGHAGPRRTAMVLLGSDRGLCGRFDEEIAEFAVARLDGRAVPVPTVVVGHRLLEQVPPDRFEVDQQLATPGSLHGIPPLVDRLIAQAEEWQEAGRFDELVLVHQRRGATHEPEPVETRLVPIPPAWHQTLGHRGWPGRGLPSWNLPTPDLLRSLLWSYLFGRVHRALIQSLEAETTARLATMQGAESNLDERRAELLQAWRRARQEAITEELFDVWQGARAARAHG